MTIALFKSSQRLKIREMKNGWIDMIRCWDSGRSNVNTRSQNFRYFDRDHWFTLPSSMFQGRVSASPFPLSLSLSPRFWRKARERRALARRHSTKVTRPLERKKRTRSTSSPRIVFEPVASALCPRESSTAVKHPEPAVSPRQPFVTFFKVIFCSPTAYCICDNDRLEFNAGFQWHLASV